MYVSWERESPVAFAQTHVTCNVGLVGLRLPAIVGEA